ncbi:MAG: cell division protein ZipA C-terminal FtsZ-binding domain-containing protein [Gammaproteobacteria bacterium]
MWELRLILILIGVVFIAAVYLLSRQKKSRPADFHRDAPKLEGSDLPEIYFDSAPPSVSPVPFLPEEPAQPEITGDGGASPKRKQLILALHVTCREQMGFAGADVLSALQASDLHYGQYQVFHRLIKDTTDQSVFSVANMVEPGVLEPESLPQVRIPGLTLFLLLPGPQDGVAACADMLATARGLARQLNGEVLDERHTPLTLEGAQQIRERILEFQRGTIPPPPH